MMKMKMKKKLEANLPNSRVKVNLPSDIVEANILTRLPAKTLIRFTAVCKSWYSLFPNTYFINIHHQIQKNKITQLVLIDERLEERLVAVTDRFSPEPQSFINYYDSVDLVGCCDGIVCVYVYVFNSSFNNFFFPTGGYQNYITLWNPALRIKKIVDISDDRSAFSFSFGFGYHRQANDYKVIKFGRHLTHVEIYSLISDSWRKIDPLGANHLFTRGDYTVEPFGICFPSGAYCWLARTRCDARDRIISFDIEDEVFKEMMLPSSITAYNCENTLFIYKDSLAVLHTHDSYATTSQLGTTFCYIWVMNEYNNPKSWTNICNFDCNYISVSFVGVVETELMVLSCIYSDNNRRTRQKAIVVDIGKSQGTFVKDVEFLMKARWVSYFTESLGLLKEVHSKSPCS